AVAHRIRHEPPRPLQGLALDVPRDLERIVLRCLEKDPEQRYPDGRALAAALEGAIAARPHAPGRIAPALPAAKLGGDDPAAAAAARSELPAREPSWGRALAPELRRLGAVFALVVIGGAVVELGLRDDDAPGQRGAEAASAAAGANGYLR